MFIRPYDNYVRLVYCTCQYLSLNKIRSTDFIDIGHHGVVSIEMKVVGKCKFAFGNSFSFKKIENLHTGKTTCNVKTNEYDR